MRDELREEIPAWLREADPLAASRIARAYSVDPPSRRAYVPLVRAHPRAVKRALKAPVPEDRLLAVTITTAAGFRHLREHGWLGPERDRTDVDLRLAYDWIRWQMVRRIPSARGRYPLWLWPAVNSTWRDTIGYAEHGDVVLVVSVPRADVLLSDFDGWHSVINLWPAFPVECSTCGTPDCDDHDAAWPKLEWPTVASHDVVSLTPGWNDIFDSTRHAEESMQITCEFVFADWVVAALEVRRARRRRA